MLALASVLAALSSTLAGCGSNTDSGIVAAADTTAENVMGTSLDSCSTAGMAMTGFTRNGHCIDAGDDDQGSHHICIQMRPDFCTVTGQPNWCGVEMTCMGDSTNKCHIKHWCLCQWAFARYLSKAGGCEKAVDLVCSATNMAAVRAYTNSTDPEHKAALACLKTKCNLMASA